MGDTTKVLIGGALALVLLGQCGGDGVGGKAKAATGGAVVGGAVGAGVGFGAGAGAAGAASGIKSGVRSRIEGEIKTAGKPRPNGPSRPFTPGETTGIEDVPTPADKGLVIVR